MSAPYILGHTDRESRRLQLQASILNPLTERLLKSSGISPGMRVLDLGCGAGDTALLAAALVGSGGEVVGIDISETSLARASLRARAANLHSVRFERADVLQYEPQSHFDAVIGRHILLHVPDALAVLERVSSWLAPGGIVAFQEYDFTSWRIAWPAVPLAETLAQSMVELFRRAAPCPDIGIRLYHLLQLAGFANPRATAECVIDGGPDSPFYEWFAETAGNLGLAPGLGDQLRKAFLEAKASIASPLIVSAWAGRD